jgi:hypothetical protein
MGREKYRRDEEEKKKKEKEEERCTKLSFSLV